MPTRTTPRQPQPRWDDLSGARPCLFVGILSAAPVGIFKVAQQRGQRVAGVFIGVAAAFQPSMLLFAPLLYLAGRKGGGRSPAAGDEVGGRSPQTGDMGRRTTAVTAVGVFALCSALAWAALPHDSRVYRVHHLAGAGLGPAPDGLGNQSLHGALLRLGLRGPLEVALFLVLAATVAVLGLRRGVRHARDGQLLLAVAITGCVAVAVSRPPGSTHCSGSCSPSPGARASARRIVSSGRPPSSS